MSLRRFLDIRFVIAAIVAGGLLWYGLTAATRESVALPLGRFGEIEKFVRDEMAASRIPGVSIAVVEDGATVYATGFGDDGNGRAITSETPFWIGSNTKSFTALAVRQLAEAGVIDIDAPIVRYLPEFRLSDAEASSRITVRHLLNQTSGFSRADGIAILLEENDESLAELVADLGDVKLNRPVGETYQYSNLNFVVLGRLVEVVSGGTWQEYVQANIFEPLGMDRSYPSLETAKASGLTQTHRYVFGFPLESEPAYLPSLAPTGYLYSTAEDMARYLAMYLGAGTLDGVSLLSPEGIEGMLTPATNRASVSLNSSRFEFQYGEGWFVGPFGAAADARWHQGSLPQFTAWMVLLPETNQAVVVLINAGSQFEIFGANQVMSRLPIGVVNLLRDEPAPTGTSISSFFVIFVTLVLLALTVQIWSFLRVARGPHTVAGGTRRALWLAPLAWELGLAIILLLLFPSMLGGNWQASMRSLPDLSLVVLTVSAIWLATGMLRLRRTITQWHANTW